MSHMPATTGRYACVEGEGAQAPTQEKGLEPTPHFIRLYERVEWT